MNAIVTEMVRVCVIGGGAAGIAAANLCIEAGHVVVGYEQMDQLGGTWIYDDPSINEHSAMYEVLKTNLPKEIMAYHDRPYDASLPSFLDRQHVLEYLQFYAQHLPFSFKHTVTKVQRTDDDKQWQVTVNNGENIERTEVFDVVFVCNGHYFKTKVPFDHSQFKGTFLHSKSYRKAQDYANQAVVIAGAGPSGVDIAMQVGIYAKNVYLIGKKATYNGLDDNITQKPYNIRDARNHEIELENGDVIQEIDTVIAATGYRYSFPFLSEKVVQIKFNETVVSPLFEHVVHVEYQDSLFFIGLNNIVLTMPLFEQQVRLALAFMDGNVQVTINELREWEANKLKELSEKGFSPDQYHLLGNDQWSYFDRISRIGKFPPMKNQKLAQELFKYIFSAKASNVCTYKNVNFVLNEDGETFEIQSLGNEEK